jgi:hypothetical protein
VCWVLTAIYVVGYVVLKIEGVNAHMVIDVVTIVRELQFLVLLGVLLAGFAAVGEADRAAEGVAPT